MNFYRLVMLYAVVYFCIFICQCKKLIILKFCALFQSSKWCSKTRIIVLSRLLWILCSPWMLVKLFLAWDWSQSFCVNLNYPFPFIYESCLFTSKTSFLFHFVVSRIAFIEKIYVKFLVSIGNGSILLVKVRLLRSYTGEPKYKIKTLCLVGYKLSINTAIAAPNANWSLFKNIYNAKAKSAGNLNL